ncbi:MAG: alpha-xylosidase [Candidatus Rokuibacteriota bacterium]|nr:MAG: alpha-xylosidase [Candidatus Rokubacteria bacterium]
MESRNLGIARALAWERTPDGIELQCVTEGLAAARVALSAVAPRVVRVRVTAGPLGAAKKFSYVIGRPDTGPWSVDAAANRVTLRTAHLVVEVSLDPWQITYRTTDGRLLTHEVPDDANFAGQRFGPRPGFQVESGPNDPARRVLGVVETLLLDPEDHFYGSGERFTRLDLVGRTVRIWNRNSYGARSELAYKNLPLVVGSRGYGIFVDVPTAVTFHLGSASNRAYTVEAAGEELDYYLIAGTPKEIVSAYTELTGRPAVPPEWAFGLWASTCFVQFTTASVLEIARRLRAEGIPCDVFHLDSFWQRALMWCDFEWDSARIPDPKHLLAELHREGFHNCLWINPYVSLQSALYREGATHGYFLRRPDGTVYHPVVWSQRTERGMGLCAIVDFTNPAAAAWYRGKLEAQLALGADSFKPDFAEEIPDDAVFANGLTGAEMHNPYPLLYQKEVFDATRAHASRVVAWSRSAAPGVQRYPGHWSGDPECTFLDLANTLRGGLAAAMSGLAYWSHDIGGFWGDPSPDLFVRWAQAGFLSGLSRYHGATAREPWRFGDEALRIFRLYARLRSRLVPYLVAYGWQASKDGVPLMRPMVMEFPDDPAGYAFDLQYCLGRELLVSPVVRADGWVTTYLPRGRWTDWWSGALHEGPTTLQRRVPLHELPLYVRDDSLVILGPERSHVGERPADPLTIEAFVTTEAAFALRGDGGDVDLTCRRRGGEVTFEASAAPATFVLRVHDGPATTAVSADGRALPRLDATSLDRGETGWTVDDRIAVVRARARRIEIR